MKNLSNKTMEFCKQRALSLYEENPNQAPIYFFLSEPCFKSLEKYFNFIWYDLDPFLKDNESAISDVCSFLGQAAWDLSGGPAIFNPVVGYAFSCTAQDIIDILVKAFDSLKNIYYQAKNTCSIYPYPYSSWELILEIVIDVTLPATSINPVQSSSYSWQFQGSNFPFTNSGALVSPIE